MNSIFRKIAFCALLGASGTAHAAPVLFPNGDFASAPTRGSWAQEFGGGTTTFNYPVSGGAGGSGGYGTMNNNGGWAVWVNSNNSFFTPAEMSTLGLVAGNGYTFFMDMKIEPGAPNNVLGRLKLEWPGGGTPEFTRTLIGDGTTWQRYTYDVIIPSGTTGLKVVPVISGNSFVGFDNIGFESVPYFVAPLPPPPPSDVVVLDRFNVASPNWTAPVIAGAGITGSSTWSNTQGNPPGSTILAATNPQVVGGNASISYVATGVNFGTGPVEISFDGRLLSALPGTAIHVRYNGNFVGAIQGSLNPNTFSTFTRTFNLSQGFTGTTTFTLTFEFAMGDVAGSGGSLAVDNIIVKTNLPPTPVPFAATIKTGKAVSWVPPNGTDAYQPQKSTDGVVFSPFGPLVIGNTQTSVFDASGASFYQVQQNAPFIQDVVYNGGFAEGDAFFGAYGWEGFQSQPPTWLTTGGRGNDGPCMKISADNVPLASGPNGSELQQNTLKAFSDPSVNTPLLGTVIPGLSYKLEFWVKQIGVGPGYVQNFNLQMLGAGNVGVLGNSGNFTCIGPVGVWTKFSTVFVAPTGAASAFVQIVGSTGGGATGFGSALIDDVSIVATGFTPLPTPLAATAINAAEVSWPSALGKNYQVQSSGDLASWANFGGVVSGDGSILAVYNAMVGPKQFYRVIRTNQ